MLAVALDMEAARRRYKVAFQRASGLVRELREACSQLTLG